MTSWMTTSCWETKLRTCGYRTAVAWVFCKVGTSVGLRRVVIKRKKFGMAGIDLFMALKKALVDGKKDPSGLDK